MPVQTATLEKEQVLDLFRRGYLNLIHLMIASLNQVSVLAQKKNRRLAAGLAIAHA